MIGDVFNNLAPSSDDNVLDVEKLCAQMAALQRARPENKYFPIMVTTLLAGLEGYTIAWSAPESQIWDRLPAPTFRTVCSPGFMLGLARELRW